MRCIALNGSGERAFSISADMKGGSGASGLEYRALSRPGGIALRETLDVPVIACVNGHAVGGGFEMVLGCDIIVAATVRPSACRKLGSAGCRSTAG